MLGLGQRQGGGGKAALTYLVRPKHVASMGLRRARTCSCSSAGSVLNACGSPGRLVTASISPSRGQVDVFARGACLWLLISWLHITW